MLESSIKRLGAQRSMLVDSQSRIIKGGDDEFSSRKMDDQAFGKAVRSL